MKRVIKGSYDEPSPMYFINREDLPAVESIMTAAVSEYIDSPDVDVHVVYNFSRDSVTIVIRNAETARIEWKYIVTLDTQLLAHHSLEIEMSREEVTSESMNELHSVYTLIHELWKAPWKQLFKEVTDPYIE